MSDRTRDGSLAGGAFPSTPASAVLAVSSDDPVTRARAFQMLVMSYWKPVYKTIRTHWRKPRDQAQDLTQAFFAQAFEKEAFGGYDPGRARFRAFLRTCLHNFLAKQEQAARRLKRGGGLTILSLDFDGAEDELAQTTETGATPEDLFDRELARSLHEHAVRVLRERLDASGRSVYFRAFERYELAPVQPTYAEIGEELGIAVTDVTNYLSYSRRELRRILCERLRQITASEEEFRAEARDLFGVEDDA